MSNIIKKAEDGIWDLLEANQKRIRHLLGTDIIIDRLAMITDVYMPAMVQHQKVFPKYKGIYKGKTIVITGTGPTFEYYTPMKDVIHIGINSAIFRKDIQYDYLFVGDYDDEKELFAEIFSCEYDFVKFFARNYRRKRSMIPEHFREKRDVETFYIDSYDYDLYGGDFKRYSKTIYNYDISVSPIKSYGTTYYCAFQFALWTHPKTIYIVGADSYGRAHAKGLNCRNIYSGDFRYLVRPWRKMKEFVDAYYPDIEIVSLNPVGLKGIFRDKYTDECNNKIIRY